MKSHCTCGYTVNKPLFFNTERLVHAFISSKIDYCNSILIGLPNEEIDKIQRVQNAAARLISGTKKYASITPILIIATHTAWS